MSLAQSGGNENLVGVAEGFRHVLENLKPWELKALKLMGEFTVAVAIVGGAVVLPPAFATVPEASAEDEAAMDILTLMRGSSGEISYLDGNRLVVMGDNRYCVVNPAVSAADSHFYWAAIGRLEAGDRHSNRVVMFGLLSDEEVDAAEHADVAWRADLGSFATATGVKVGAGKILHTDEEC